MAPFPEQLPHESSPAYQAACRYFNQAMGARSSARVGVELGKSTTLMDRWCAVNQWVVRAKGYDRLLAIEAQQTREAAYGQEVAHHRGRAREASNALYVVAGQLTKAINQLLLNPKVIIDQDGVEHPMHSIEINANTLAIAARAIQTSLDLEAHALGIDILMRQFDE